MSSTFNEANLVKKLENVTSSQDSIQTLSLWMLHHKSHYKKIVDQWLKCYTKAKSTHQLALFYLANDIVQHAKRKNYANYLAEFENALKEAAKVTNDEKIKTSINRVLNIWIERSVYSKTFVEELRLLLGGEKVKVEVMSKIISDFSLNDVVQQINNVVKLEQYTQSKIQNLANCNVDFTNPDLLNKLKDKSYGEQFSKEIEEASKALNSIINSIEREISYRRTLLTSLEKSKIFYNVQMKEAKTVAETFNNCELRLKQVQAVVSKSKNCSTNNNSLSSLANTISTSQLSNVLSLIQQATSSSTTGQPSSLDQRLNSLMSSSGQFQMNIDQNLSFNQNFNNYNAANNYSQGSYNDNRTSEPVLTTRNNEPTENFEPADMDLGDSEDEDGNTKSVNKVSEVNKNSNDSRKRPLEETLSQFSLPQELGPIFPLIPPPPPPPMPPPLLREIFENDLDKFTPGQQTSLPESNSMRNSGDRYSPRNQTYNNQAQQGGSAHQWRNHQGESRGPSRNYHYSNHNRHGNRWKNNGTGGNWKRNSFGSSNHY